MHLNGPGAGIWDFTVGSPFFSHYTLKGETRHKIVSLSFSSNSQWLAGTAQWMYLWDMRTGKRIARSEMVDPRMGQFEVNGRNVFACGSKIGLRRYQIQATNDSGQLEVTEVLKLLDGNVNRFALSPDSQTIAAIVGRKVALLDAATGLSRTELVGHSGISSLSFAPGGRWLAAGCWRGKGVRVWDLHNPNDDPIDFITDENKATVYFSPDGQWLVTAIREGFRFWKTGSWDEGTPIPLESTSGACAFHPTEPIFAYAAGAESIHLMNLNTRTVFAHVRPGAPSQLEFSPDGTMLAAANSRRNVYVWNLPMMRKELGEMGLDW